MNGLNGPTKIERTLRLVATEYLIVDHLSLKQIIRIFSHITVSIDQFHNNIPCWNWHRTAPKSKYGQVQWNGGMVSPHRLMYAWIIGPIPKKKRNEAAILEIDHLCFNTLCVNPVHLRLIPKPDNIIGPKHHANKTHCANGHEFTPENTYWYGPNKTHRQCLECANARTAIRIELERTDPVYAQRKKDRARRYSQKPESRKKKAQRARERRAQDEQFRLAENDRKRKWRQEKEQNPQYRAERNARKREWRRNRKELGLPRV